MHVYTKSKQGYKNAKAQWHNQRRCTDFHFHQVGKKLRRFQRSSSEVSFFFEWISYDLRLVSQKVRLHLSFYLSETLSSLWDVKVPSIFAFIHCCMCVVASCTYSISHAPIAVQNLSNIIQFFSYTCCSVTKKNLSGLYWEKSISFSSPCGYSGALKPFSLRLHYEEGYTNKTGHMDINSFLTRYALKCTFFFFLFFLITKACSGLTAWVCDPQGRLCLGLPARITDYLSAIQTDSLSIALSLRLSVCLQTPMSVSNLLGFIMLLYILLGHSLAQFVCASVTHDLCGACACELLPVAPPWWWHAALTARKLYPISLFIVFMVLPSSSWHTRRQVERSTSESKWLHNCPSSSSYIMKPRTEMCNTPSPVSFHTPLTTSEWHSTRDNHANPDGG